MPRVTKIMLASEVKGLSVANQQLRSENEHLKEINRLLTKGHFDLEAFNRMHEGVVTSLSRVIDNFKQLFQSRNL